MIPRIQMLDGGTGLNFGQLFGDILTNEHITAEIHRAASAGWVLQKETGSPR